MARLPAFLAVLLPMAGAIVVDHQNNICGLPFCGCYPDTHPNWTIVNCTVDQIQNKILDIQEGGLPENTAVLSITGVGSLTLDSNCLSALHDVRHVYLSAIKLVVLKQYAAVDLDVVNLYLEIERCDVVRIEQKCFAKIKGPLTVSIQDCDYVLLENEAFAWLLKIQINDIRQLQIASGAFMLERSAPNVGAHGPGMTIELKRVKISELPARSFGSSAALIHLDTVDIHKIRLGAFSANTYNIVMATNCSFYMLEGESFAPKSFIKNLYFDGCNLNYLASNALQSAVEKLNITQSSFHHIETGAIKSTVVAAVIVDSRFHEFATRGFELTSWNRFIMKRNSFDELPTDAIVAPGGSIHELIFSENEIETIHPRSLAFIGESFLKHGSNVKYENNYFGRPCECNISSWLADGLGAKSGEPFESESHCTVDEFFARCFNVPEQNMKIDKFLKKVCTSSPEITCEAYKSKTEGSTTEIKNPRFPHKNSSEEGLSERNKKVIGIVIVAALGCVIIVLFVSFIRWMRRRGYCDNLKNILISSNSSCGSLCDRFCVCGRNSGIDNARSLSQISIHEYSERRRLNEPRVAAVPQETTFTTEYTEEVVPTEDRMTQTLPEQLTKELLDNLKERLDDPDRYVEARELIEHLYELIKIEENCNANVPVNVEENIYELPFQNTAPRLGKNKKNMVSVSTRVPSLDKLVPLSLYEGEPPLAREYFEPQDLAVHLYAEIANYHNSKGIGKGKNKITLGAIPDVVSEQAVPRGPYLRAVREKLISNTNTNPTSNSLSNPVTSPHISTIKSNKSTASNSSGKMMNRPLPEKPKLSDTGEGTSFG